MAAHDLLSAAQFIHVSPHQLAEGTVLRPSGDTGSHTFGSHGGHPHVFMSDNAEDAQEWAGHVGYAAEAPEVHYYEVQPHGDVQRQETEGLGEVTAPSARVIRHLMSEQMPASWD